MPDSEIQTGVITWRTTCMKTTFKVLRLHLKSFTQGMTINTESWSKDLRPEVLTA